MPYQAVDRQCRQRGSVRGKRFGLPQKSLFACLAVLVVLAADPAFAVIISLGDVAVVPLVNVDLRVGNSAVGNVIVNGGSVLSGTAGLPPVPTPFTSVMIGFGTSSVGTVTVDGAGSMLIANTLPPSQPGVAVGVSGQGTLNVTGGGAVSSSRVDAGCPTVLIPVVCGPTSNILVNGTGSTITSGSVFNIGVNGSATAQITNGGIVNAQTSNIGSLAGSNGKVTVSGAGSALNLVTGATPVPAFGRAFLNVGLGQQGQLDVLAGGKVLIDAAPLAGNPSTGMTVGGVPASGNGTLNIDGTGSELRIRGTNPISNIGRQGTAVVNITNGGKLITESTDSGNSFVGRLAGSSGTVNVTGAGSEWQAGRRLFIGSDASAGVPVAGGTGKVNVAAGGTVTAAGTGADAIFIGAGGKLTGGGGTVIGNVTNSGTLAPGNSPGIMTFLGNLTLNPAGTVDIELGGTDIALAPYDQLNVFDNPATTSIEGKISVNGTVKVSLFNGFNPIGGSFFDVFTALDILEIAPIYDLPALSGGLHWEHALVNVDNGREALRLTVAPEPGSLGLLAFGAGALVLARRRRAS
jgi:T5SS/PEP-CTERM-associated repeat protein